MRIKEALMERRIRIGVLITLFLASGARVSKDVTVTSSEVNIRTTQRVITCPGRRVAPGPRPRTEYAWEDTDPVNIRLSAEADRTGNRDIGCAHAGCSARCWCLPWR